MPIRLRKFLGVFILIGGLFAYAIATTFLWFWIVDLTGLDHWAPMILFYIFAGFIWAFPGRRLIWWMEGVKREDIDRMKQEKAAAKAARKKG